MNDFLYLLRCALWDVKPEVAFLDDWNAVVKIAKEQAVFGLVGYVALQTEAVGQLLPESHLLLQQQVNKLVVSSRGVNHLIGEMTEALSRYGIEAVLLKGQGIAAFYPHPELRYCGDVDLLVRPAEYEKAEKVLKLMATPEALQNAHTSEKHYHITIKDSVVELHWCTMHFEDSSIDSKYKAWEECSLKAPYDNFILDGKYIHRLSATYNAFYVFLHFWEHFLNRGIGLRQVSDWMMLLHGRNAEIDRRLLKEHVEEFGLLRPWQLFGCLVVHYLGLPADEMPFYEPAYLRKSSRLMRMIIKEGNFGKAMKLSQRHARQHGFRRRLTTLFAIQIHSWRVFSLLPQEGWQIWKSKMKGGFGK